MSVATRLVRLVAPAKAPASGAGRLPCAIPRRGPLQGACPANTPAGASDWGRGGMVATELRPGSFS
jgi:hypothetical protein